MLVQGSSIELRCSELAPLSVTPYATLGALNSPAVNSAITAVLRGSSIGEVNTPYFKWKLNETPRALGIPCLEVVRLGSITWALGTLEAQMLSLVKDRALMLLETKNASVGSEFAAAKQNAESRIATLAALDGRLRSYFDSAVGWDTNYFYVLADADVAEVVGGFGQSGIGKSALVNHLYSGIARDFGVPIGDARPYLQDTTLSDWIDTSRVYVIPKQAVANGRLTTVRPVLKDWCVNLYTSGSRKTARELIERAVDRFTKFGVVRATANVHDAACSAIKAVLHGFIDMDVTGVNISDHPLRYPSLTLVSSSPAKRTYAWSNGQVIFTRTRDTLQEYWDALDDGLRLEIGLYDDWDRTLTSELLAFWQLSWSGIPNPRAGSITAYVPGTTLQCNYMWPLVSRLRGAGLREYSNGIA